GNDPRVIAIALFQVVLGLLNQRELKLAAAAQRFHVIDHSLQVVVRHPGKGRHRRPLGAMANDSHEVLAPWLAAARRGSEFEDALAIVARRRIEVLSGGAIAGAGHSVAAVALL